MDKLSYEVGWLLKYQGPVIDDASIRIRAYQVGVFAEYSSVKKHIVPYMVNKQTVSNGAEFKQFEREFEWTNLSGQVNESSGTILLGEEYMVPYQKTYAQDENLGTCDIYEESASGVVFQDSSGIDYSFSDHTLKRTGDLDIACLWVATKYPIATEETKNFYNDLVQNKAKVFTLAHFLPIMVKKGLIDEQRAKLIFEKDLIQCYNRLNKKINKSSFNQTISYIGNL